jgi:pseudaminic acid cytidylyltransferase
MVMTSVAIIPARGGSKRIPRKNLKLFHGKPIIAYSIEASLSSGLYDKVIVSTDDDEIAKVAQSYGADIPFLRPAELSNDSAATLPVVQHALRALADDGAMFDFACCIYATAPFIRESDLALAFDRLASRADKSYSFAVTSYPFPIQRAVKLETDGTVAMFQPEFFQVRSQDLEPAYHDAGQFYWGRSAAWLRGDIMFSSVAVPIVLERQRVQDIDTEEDWRRAELLYMALKSPPRPVQA